MRLEKVILGILGLALISVSCSDNSCYDNGSALPLVRFYAMGSTSQVMLSGVTIRGIDAPGDSILVENSAVTEIYLPLRANVNTTQWEFSFPELGIADTLTLNYRAIPYFSSVECGAMYNFELSSVTMTYNMADSVAVVKTLIDNGIDVAIRLFYTAEE